MRVDVVQNGRVLRRIAHQGQVYVEAPTGGTYQLRVYNSCPRRRMAVISVDGINVIDGETAGHDGPGYVLDPSETMNSPGWRRSDDTVASFEFKPEGDSYSAQTGRGTRNVGVVGVAVFDEKTCRVVKRRVKHHHHHHHYDWDWDWWPRRRWVRICQPTITTIPCSTTTTYTTSTDANDGDQTLSFDSANVEVTCSAAMPRSAGEPESVYMAQSAPASDGILLKDCESTDVGTGYGAEAEFQTTSTKFTKATDHPAEVIMLRYATRERLQSWGVPVDKPGPQEADPFPAARTSCPAPPGWTR